MDKLFTTDGSFSRSASPKIALIFVRLVSMIIMLESRKARLLIVEVNKRREKAKANSDASRSASRTLDAFSHDVKTISVTCKFSCSKSARFFISIYDCIVV